MRERYLATRQTSHIRNISRSCHHPATEEISRLHEKDCVFKIEYNFVRFSDGFNRSFGVAMQREAWIVKRNASLILLERDIFQSLRLAQYKRQQGATPSQTEGWMVKRNASFEKEVFPQTPFQKTFSTAKNADSKIDIFRRNKNFYEKRFCEKRPFNI
ncbi:hypothetical protein J7M00_01820 [bacterium]|nr:hypothetical protein [bacterium]